MKKQYSYVAIVILILHLFSCQDTGSTAESTTDSEQELNTQTEKVRVDDMILEKKFITHVRNQNEVSAQAAGGYSVYSSQPWKGGVIPVVFSAAITKSDKDWFIKVAKKWNTSTGVSIVNRTNQADYLYVKNDESGCYSELGARAGQIRTMNLGKNCWTEPIALHELGHALGLMHEHQRPDRNSYISINLKNADSAYHFAFALFNTMNNATTYDFTSIMHYSQYAFSNNNKPTLNALPKYASYQNVMGIKKISAQDRKAVAAMYASTLAQSKSQ